MITPKPTHKLVQPFGTMFFRKEGSEWLWFNKDENRYQPTKLLQKPKILAQVVQV